MFVEERSRSAITKAASTSTSPSLSAGYVYKGDGEGVEALPIGETFLCRVEKFLFLHPTNLTKSSAARRISRKIKPNFASCRARAVRTASDPTEVSTMEPRSPLM